MGQEGLEPPKSNDDWFTASCNCRSATDPRSYSLINVRSLRPESNSDAGFTKPRWRPRPEARLGKRESNPRLSAYEAGPLPLRYSPMWV